ncbi:ShlB/FhaC/HecB family hemolysin secretion/activation protein [Klebsiella sp. BIGb0407]|uniref:ShlB/FhaC/HecB family hemolysin secretion/activation protein n=1 Tax=Klebsiella sp. BIGb0407 TaxID=2940603 RepID=UPI0021685043|nr:ShlB/FhaC/HecB family hemolysin secretion/activation protein [Klebsiella sp. BIGb0407]MCS3432232.1 hemolysin activation/secretion protein [Klebsiella sp. BIGb0407]
MKRVPRGLKHAIIFRLFCGLLLFSVTHRIAQGNTSQTAEQHFSHLLQQQEQQQKARNETLIPRVPDIHITDDSPLISRIQFPVEQPCFMIHTVTLNGQDTLPHWVPLTRLANQASGHCLGVKGINLVMETLQNRLIGHGWITTRVLAPSQDLSSGVLRLQIVPGKVRDITLTASSSTYSNLYTLLPAHSGHLLDVRDIEQGLENLQRLPTVSASMKLRPGDIPGESDIVIERTQSRMWRLGAWLDDTGSKNTGLYQGGVMLALDNPTSLSDLFYLTAGRDLRFGGQHKSSQNYSAHYSVPFGYWLAAITASDYLYHQTQPGKYHDINYSGRSQSLDLQLNRVLHRNATSKTTVSYKVRVRDTKNLINNTPSPDHKIRRTSAWRTGLSHRHYLGPTTLDTGVNYQQGTRWFGALPVYTENGNDSATSKILTWNASLTTPFSVVGQDFSWNILWRRQISHTPLTPLDEFVIGNRWTVRGFDGERTLSAINGWMLQNTLSWRTPLPSQELYFGSDYGAVSGSSSTQTDLTGKHIAGLALGLRGTESLSGLSYDLSAGIPLSKPDGFKTAPMTMTFSLNWNW